MKIISLRGIAAVQLQEGASHLTRSGKNVEVFLKDRKLIYGD